MKQKRYPSMKHRLLANIQIKNQCWIWTGKLHAKGYGQLTVWCKEKKYAVNKYAHRVSHEAFVGPIPENHEVDHRCRNRACINPDHLEAVTGKENLKRRDVHRQMLKDGSELVTFKTEGES